LYNNGREPQLFDRQGEIRIHFLSLAFLYKLTAPVISIDLFLNPWRPLLLPAIRQC